MGVLNIFQLVNYRVNIPSMGSVGEMATSSYSLEYWPDALRWKDPAHCDQAPAYRAKTVT